MDRVKWDIEIMNKLLDWAIPSMKDVSEAQKQIIQTSESIGKIKERSRIVDVIIRLSEGKQEINVLELLKNLRD